MNNEYIEIFDDDYKSLGRSKSLNAHIKGDWHNVVHCWIIDEKTNMMLYQRRSKLKLIYPNKLDVSAAGHCLYKEQIENTAIREIEEELGLKVNKKILDKIGIRKDISVHEGLVNKEFQHIFFIKLNIDIPSLIIDKEELEEIYFINPNDVIDVFNSKVQIKINGWNGEKKISKYVASNDFIDSIDKYNLKIPIFVNRYLNGENEFTFN